MEIEGCRVKLAFLVLVVSSGFACLLGAEAVSWKPQPRHLVQTPWGGASVGGLLRRRRRKSGLVLPSA